MANTRQKTAIGMGVDDGQSTVFDGSLGSPTPRAMTRNTFGMARSEFRASSSDFDSAPETQGSTIQSINDYRASIWEQKGFAATNRKNGLLIAGPSAPSPVYTNTIPQQGMSRNVYATEWENVISTGFHPFPLTPFHVMGPYWGANLLRSLQNVYPPYVSGQAYISGYNAGNVDDPLVLQLAPATGNQLVYLMPAGSFSVWVDINPSDIGWINAGHYADIPAFLGMPENDDSRIYAVSWFLQA